MSGTLGAMSEFMIPDGWSIYGDPCPCCGGDGDYSESPDGMVAGWEHAEGVAPDGCTWNSLNPTQPCPRWPHQFDGERP